MGRRGSRWAQGKTRWRPFSGWCERARLLVRFPGKHAKNTPFHPRWETLPVRDAPLAPSTASPYRKCCARSGLAQDKGGSATGEFPVARGQARPPGAQKTAFGTVPWLFGVHRGGILVPWGHLDFRLFDRPEVNFGRPDRPRATSSGQSVCRDRVCTHRAAWAQERHVFST